MSLYDSIDIYLDSQEDKKRAPIQGQPEYINPIALQYRKATELQEQEQLERRDRKNVLYDIVGAGLWTTLDEYSFGVAGSLLPGLHEEFQPTTGAGRIAAGIGGTIGFIKGAPMKVGTKAAQLAAKPFIKAAGYEAGADISAISAKMAAKKVTSQEGQAFNKDIR